MSSPSILVHRQDVSMARNCLDSYLVAPSHQSIQDRDHPIIDTQISTSLKVQSFLEPPIGSTSIAQKEVIVQGDEGPVCGVAQGVDCHGVTVGHEEREEEEVEQEVESDGEKTLKERCACPWMG